MKQRARSVCPCDDHKPHNICPVEGEPRDQTDDGNINEERAPNNTEFDIEDMADKYEELRQKVEEHIDQENHGRARKVPVVKAPDRPSKAEWERHQATHTPFANWCKHCQAARAIRHKHPARGRKAIIVLDVERDIEGPVKVSIDYMYLHERVGEFKNEEVNPPQLVMVDHKSGRVWAHRVPNKGVLEEAAWLPRRLIQDLENCAYTNTKIQLKSNQEPTTIAVQTAMQEMQANIIPTNSHVGGSESNGRVENVIRRVQEKIES